MENKKHLQSFFIVLFCLVNIELSMTKKEMIQVPVGVVLDLNSPVGAIAQSCMAMAQTDFYTKHAHYRTRLDFRNTRDSKNDIVTAASEAWNMIKKEKLHAIVGPQSSAEAKFVIELGKKARVPIISFSATSPFLSPSHSPFFIRTAIDDAAQVKALAAVVKAYVWLEVVLVYEDTDYGNGLIQYLTAALEEVGARVTNKSVIHPSSNDTEILMELDKLNSGSTRIFLVHMTASLGSKFFMLANKAQMMREGYAWIVTQGLSTLLDPVGRKAMDSMQGVLGVRPYIQKTKNLEDFKLGWKRMIILKKPRRMTRGLNLFGLWAYDTVWALAMAAEKVGAKSPSSFKKQNVSTSKVNLSSLGTSDMGKNLLETILSLKFQSLTGIFQLVKGQLEPSSFEIFNVIEHKERVIGYWSPLKGLSRHLKDYVTSEVENSDVKSMLKQPIWPGDTTLQPATKQLWRIGVPVKVGFNEFLKVENNSTITGFSARVFFKAEEKLPFRFPHVFLPFTGTYNDLIWQIKDGVFDAVVGDTTIVANRSLYVDFTLPYSESGVSMVVLLEDNERNIWLFLKPLRMDLWLTSVAAFIFTGLVIWVLEHRVNPAFRGPPHQQLGMIFWFSFSTLVFAHREKVVNNWSRLVMIIWVFVVLILTQSYAASLASILTVQKLQPLFTDIREIQRKGYNVGYQSNSFVEGLLTDTLRFANTKLRAYETAEDYERALSNGTVAAIVDENPYLQLFIAKNCSKYTMVGLPYKTDGFGFAFPKGSPLVSYMSSAILNVTQDTTRMAEILSESIGNASCEDESSKISSGGQSLGVYSFGGLFIIVGAVSMFSLLLYVYHFLYSNWHALRTRTNSESSSFWSKVVRVAEYFDKEGVSSHDFKRGTSRVHDANTHDDDQAIGIAADENDAHKKSAPASNETMDNTVTDGGNGNIELISDSK